MRGDGAAGALHAAMCDAGAPDEPMAVQLRRMLVGWLLVHTHLLDAALSCAASMPAPLESAAKPALAHVWRAAETLSREMASWNLVQALKCAEFFLATSPLAAPRPARPPAAAQVASSCELLSEQAMQLSLIHI